MRSRVAALSVLLLSASTALATAVDSGDALAAANRVGATGRLRWSLRKHAHAAAAHESSKAPHASEDATPAAVPGYRFAQGKTEATSQTHVGEGGPLGTCKNCIYVMERIKQGYQYLLPSICVEVFSKTKSQEEYTTCHNVVAALSASGHNVRHWIKQGCYKSEPYGAQELIKPCPSHVICSQITNLADTAFCKPPGSDFVDGEVSGSGSGSGSPSDEISGDMAPPPVPPELEGDVPPPVVVPQGFSGSVDLGTQSGNLVYSNGNANAGVVVQNGQLANVGFSNNKFGANLDLTNGAVLGGTIGGIDFSGLKVG